MNEFYRGFVEGVQWGTSRVVRGLMLFILVTIGTWLSPDNGKQPAEIKLTDATLTDITSLILSVGLTILLVWAVLFHEDRK